MGEFFQDQPEKIKQQLVDNWVTLMFVAVLLVVIGAAQQIAGRLLPSISDHPGGALAFFFLVLAVIGVAAYIAVNIVRRRKVEKLDTVARALYASDAAVALWLRSDNPFENARKDCKTTVKGMLEYLCSSVATKVDFDNTGASFLILEDDTENSRFASFAQCHHEHASYSDDIRRLTRLHSLAGYSITSGELQKVKNCNGRRIHSHWNDAYSPSSRNRDGRRKPYLGRACTAVRGFDGNLEIGALCIDFGKKCSISKEDEAVLVHFASKIGSLCEIFAIYPIKLKKPVDEKE